ncbi:11281_t:CDS:2, partial [Funneliformis geosporum]
MKVGQLKYIDSMQFMNTSLANFTKNLVGRKRVYSYEYINSHDRFKETKLPLIHEFHGILSDEYHDHYLKTDVLSLADIWIQLRKMSMEYDGLNPNMDKHDFIEKAK